MGRTNVPALNLHHFDEACCPKPVFYLPSQRPLEFKIIGHLPGSVQQVMRYNGIMQSCNSGTMGEDHVSRYKKQQITGASAQWSAGNGLTAHKLPKKMHFRVFI
jgi:hypothetical protein